MTDPFDAFRRTIRSGGIEALRAGLIGQGRKIYSGPWGEVEMVYADWVASGRALEQVEHFILHEVLPDYANSHTEASYCGRQMSRLREAARRVVLRQTGADETCHAIFSGSGATAGLNRIVHLLGVAARVRAGDDVRVLIGPYEHHSNILPWRESGAWVEAIAEAPAGGVDLDQLEAALTAASGADLVIGAFSAASNVTGIVTPPEPVTRILKRHGAMAIWDYAGGGPYLPIDMSPAPDALIDAVVLSPHKFPGGPGASGLLVVRDTVLRNAKPSAPGGGTVRFVSPWLHDYAPSPEAREEGGTPNIVGDIRAALCLIVKDAIGTEDILRRDDALYRQGRDRLGNHPRIDLLGNPDAQNRLPVFSFRIRKADGSWLHHQLATRLLSDCYGIQARGGCACAGPYAHDLLDLDQQGSQEMRAAILAGQELEKLGWVRLNLSYMHSPVEAERILSAVISVADQADSLEDAYSADPATARFSPRLAMPASA
ncbi:aminotransferase class V-fold PLP-dependent enzyme [Pseudoroseicyclus sp. H15]